MTRTVTIEEVKNRTLDEVLREVTQNQDTLRVQMPEGETVEIKPLPKLKPLTRLEGYVPDGWKDAIYEPKR